jgi:hypothetical protein
MLYWSGSLGPDQFYPERFLIEDQHSNDNRAASIPFGGGHRQCIGKDLARFELKVICARLMQHVTFGDGGPETNSGGYKQTDTIIPKNIIESGEHLFNIVNLDINLSFIRYLSLQKIKDQSEKTNII